ncbi:MAG: addiction module protein [Geodermatophilaceae bacterium]|jgi:putative addiction module component (TIGR02574 family)|nr:addiction module protein [Geodermatophilaceae bacterium]
MAAGVDEITQAALTLRDEERAALASTLLASLDEPADDPLEVEAAWDAEIEHRVDDMSGRVNTIPWEQIKAELAERRGSRHR